MLWLSVKEPFSVLATLRQSFPVASIFQRLRYWHHAIQGGRLPGGKI